MELQLNAAKAKKIILEGKEVKSSETSFSFRIGVSDKDKNVFGVQFIFSLDDEEENYRLETVYETSFTTSEEVDAKFMDSNFAKVNAPAIAFPYFRAFITTITQQAGYKAVVLPSFNFIELARNTEDIKDETLEG